VRSCLYLAVQADGRQITTIEGLGNADGSLGLLQEAFHRNFALQCGFCTPGFLMSLDEILERNPEPGEAELREALSGNMCRCTGYDEIVRAGLEAAAELRRRKQGEAE
jgi:aerobic-type carbon monoxide dehydrogenase small subunit (CoxS/CutS family)